MASPAIDHSLDSQTKVPEIISIISVCCVVTTLMVTLRVITRALIVRAFGPDDWVLVVAQFLAIAAAVAIGLEQHYGLGRHIWTVPDLVPYLKSFYASILIYNASLVMVKISIVLMYRRIFVGKGMQRATLVGLLILVAWGIALLGTLTMICLPVQMFWDPTVSGHCLPFVPAFYAPGVINMITDFSIFLMPLPAIKQLQLPTKQKIILSFILCLGFFTCVISIIRLCTLGAAATTVDSTWDNTEAAMWSYLELAVALVAACLPTLRPLMARFFPRFMSGGSSSSAGDNNANLGTEGRQPTWGGSSSKSTKERKGTSAQYSDADSTEALHAKADPEIGLQPLPPPATAEDIQEYKEAVARRRGMNETVIGAGYSPPGSRAPGQSVEHVEDAARIRATTVIKQEYQKTG